MGEFVDALQIRGEIKAGRSITLTAPAEAGDLRILTIARGGTAVKKGDVVVEFDGSTVSRTLEEKGTELRGYEAEIEKVRAQSRTKEEAGVTAATKADYEVQRGTLDYSARDILSRVEGEQKRLAVLDSGQKLREAHANLASTRAPAAKPTSPPPVRSARSRSSNSKRPAASVRHSRWSRRPTES